VGNRRVTFDLIKFALINQSINRHSCEHGRMKYFAEALPKLGVVNLQVQLDDESNKSISLSTIAGNRECVLLRDNAVSNLLLPLVPSKSEILTHQINQRILSARISTTPVNANEDPVCLLPAEEIQKHWVGGGKLLCKRCHIEICSRTALRWKDLPSESWLEFADYWLCHSGRTNSHSHSHSHSHPTHQQENSLFSESISAKPGLGLVGLTFLVLHQEDLGNIRIKVRPINLPLDLKESIAPA